MNRKILGLSLALAMLVVASGYPPAEAGWRDRVYAMSDQRRNEVVVFDREADGSLTHFADFRTGGRGIADRTCPEDALGSQDPLIVTQNGKWVITTNPSSNNLTVFRASPGGLTRTDKVNSGGKFPSSLTLKKGMLYVLNSGGQGNITGFWFSKQDGSLTPIPESTRGLNVGGDNPPFFLVSPAQVSFNPRGTLLATTVKGDNTIRMYSMQSDGTPSSNPVVNISNGNTPFGFSFASKGRLLVAEAFGNLPVGSGAAGAVSSYRVRPGGQLDVISSSVDNFQTAACWLHKRGNRYAYTTNNFSGPISRDANPSMTTTARARSRSSLPTGRSTTGTSRGSAPGTRMPVLARLCTRATPSMSSRALLRRASRSSSTCRRPPSPTRDCLGWQPPTPTSLAPWPHARATRRSTPPIWPRSPPWTWMAPNSRTMT